MYSLQDVKEAMTGEEQVRGKSEAGASCGVGEVREWMCIVYSNGN